MVNFLQEVLNGFRQAKDGRDNALFINGTTSINKNDRSAFQLDEALKAAEASNQTIATGLLTTIDGTNTDLVAINTATSIDVKGGTGQVVNRDNVLSGIVTVTPVSWPTRTNVDIGPLLPATDGTFPVAIDINGDVVILGPGGGGLSIPQQWDYIQVGTISVTSGNIDLLSISVFPAYAVGLEPYVVGGILGFANDKINPFSIEESDAQPTTLKLKVNPGQAHAPLEGWAVDPRLPGVVISTTETDPAPALIYALRDGGVMMSGTAEIDPNNYESSPGTLTSVGTNKFTIQKVFLFAGSKTIGVQYGTADYVSLNDAINAAGTTIFPRLAALSTAFPVAFLAIKQGITQFTNPGVNFQFFDAES